MTSWITERDYRQANAAGLGIGLNVAFIREIKEDNVEFRELFDEVETKMIVAPNLPEREDVVTELHRVAGQLRDELETYFALEEFYGGFGAQEPEAKRKSVPDQGDLSRQTEKLRLQHVDLYLELDRIVESIEKMVYAETSLDDVGKVSQTFKTFAQNMKSHESFEMEIIMRQCNEELGTGD